MISRGDVLSKAVDDCLEELYTLVVPKVTWEEFKNECKIYSEKYKKWESERKTNPELDKKSKTECIGPAPYEFYFLPREIIKDICDSYVYAYKMDNQQELLDTIETLKNYCKKPIVDKWIEGELREDGTRWPGYRGYDHPDNLEKEIEKILFGRMSEEPGEYREESAKILQNKFFEFLDMAGNFFNWNRDLNSFNVSVYLGPSPNSNKEAVIENWKKYKNQDIEIDEEQIKKDYYDGEDELD
jgi:hypothetical protein